MKLHLFNPDHDMALAANLSTYTAPHAGRQLRSDLDFLPALWADEGDVVLVDDVDNAFDKLRHIVSGAPKADFVTWQGVAHLASDIDGVSPWGWNPALVAQLRRAGVSADVLPSQCRLEAIRALSARMWAARHLQQGVAVATSADELEAACKARQSGSVVKTPWSSSGRGVRYVGGQLDDDTRRWAMKALRQQGAVVVEPLYNKVEDFGMEFYAHADGRITYEGLSIFTAVKGAYQGSLLAPEHVKEQLLTRFVPQSAIEESRQHVISGMSEAVKGVYEGPFGVDMMVCREAGNTSADAPLWINRCVEVNLRRTMGHVALALTPMADINWPSLMRVDYDGNRYHLRVNKAQLPIEARTIC